MLQMHHWASVKDKVGKEKKRKWKKKWSILTAEIKDVI